MISIERLFLPNLYSFPGPLKHQWPVVPMNSLFWTRNALTLTCYVHSDELIWKVLTFYTHLNIRNMGMGWKQQESLNLHECWFQLRRVGWAGDKFLEQKDILGQQQLVVRQYVKRDWSSLRLAILHISILQMTFNISSRLNSLFSFIPTTCSKFRLNAN